MEAFWRWLLKANARGVLVSAVLALVMVTSWWTWRELNPIEPEKNMLSSRGTEELNDTLGLLDLLPSSTATNAATSLPNPFAAPWVRRHHSSTNQVPRWQKPDRKPKPAVATPVKPPPEAAGPQFEEITVVFQGLLTRTDGKTLALIRDSKQGRVAFYTEGSDLLGFKVNAITAVTTDVLTPGGETRTLNINQPQTFRVRIE